MCTTCGCGNDNTLINNVALSRRNHKRSANQDGSAASAKHLLFRPHQQHHDPAPAAATTRRIQIERSILAKNDALAADNRAFFTERNILALNLVSSPGSGKTTLLVRAIESLKGQMAIAVIEGDQQTDNDAERIRATGVQAVQINTGKGCHLDSEMVGHALEQMALPDGALLFIENVGNLVCPAAFDLGEAAKVVVLSVTEGEDKPLKYPDMFRAARLLLLNKCDLLPHLSFDIELAESYARRVNPDIEIIRLSATSGEGMDAWLDWLTGAMVQCAPLIAPNHPLSLGGRGLGRGGLNEFIERIIPLPRPVKPVLAMGAWLKNTVCIASGQEAFVSKSVGDLDSPDACRAHMETARTLLDWMGEKPAVIAHDLHPDFHSSRFAAALAAELNVPLVAVQHHHAHIAAITAESQIDGPVLGLALDGVGLGTDGSAWGGELLRVDGAAFERIGHLRPLPLPGGDRAAREPWRMAAAVLHELGRNEEIAQRFANEPAAATVATMLQRGLNCPRTSSMGRVFDAAAGLLGLCHKMEFEAQAALALEHAATHYIAAHGMPQPLANGWHIDQAGQLDLLPLLALLAGKRDVEYGAAVFHATLIAALIGWLGQAAQRSGVKTIACGGGCFFNKLLSAGLRERLDGAGLRTFTAKLVQPGDTAIALGQAWVAGQLVL